MIRDTSISGTTLCTDVTDGKRPTSTYEDSNEIITEVGAGSFSDGTSKVLVASTELNLHVWGVHPTMVNGMVSRVPGIIMCTKFYGFGDYHQSLSSHVLEFAK